MQMRFSLVAPKLFDLAVAALSFFLFVASFKFNEFFDPYFLYAPGINLVFLPAGVKLLCIIVGRVPAVVGLFLASVYLSTGLWHDLNIVSYYYFAAVSLFTYSLAVFLTFRLYSISSTLANLKFFHIVIMSILACALNGVLHNLVFMALGITNHADLWVKSAVMGLGDLIGCIVVISSFNFVSQLFQRQSKPLI
jgi:hypothetical protein